MNNQDPFAGQNYATDDNHRRKRARCLSLFDGPVTLAQAVAYKQQTYNLLQIQPGHRLLDVGCGVGDDVLAMAERVGDSGLVVGVDSSETMIQAARDRVAGMSLPIDFRVGTVTQLAYPDASFDGVRADDVFRQLAQLAQACAEMVRVARPGGCIVAFEPDFDGIVFHTPDAGLIRGFMRTYSTRFARKQGAHRLDRLFKEAGLTEVTLIPKAFAFTKPEDAEDIALLSDVVKEIIAARPDQAPAAATWLHEVQQTNERDHFCFLLLGVFAAGQKTER